MIWDDVGGLDTLIAVLGSVSSESNSLTMFGHRVE